MPAASADGWNSLILKVHCIGNKIKPVTQPHTLEGSWGVWIWTQIPLKLSCVQIKKCTLKLFLHKYLWGESYTALPESIWSLIEMKDWKYFLRLMCCLFFVSERLCMDNCLAHKSLRILLPIKWNIYLFLLCCQNVSYLFQEVKFWGTRIDDTHEPAE